MTERHTKGGESMKLREMRLRQGLTQDKLAEISGVSQVYISRLEVKNKQSAGYVVLKKLAIALGCSIEDLLDPIPQEMVKTG